MQHTAKAALDAANVFGTGAPNDAYAQYFVGQSFVQPLTARGEAGVNVSNVTFEPGCRNNWHIHRASRGGGQILLCTAGQGWFQCEGHDPVSMTPGTTIVVPADVKHWHGATVDSWFSHIALEVPGEDTSNEWLEPVDEEYYRSL